MQEFPGYFCYIAQILVSWVLEVWQLQGTLRKSIQSNWKNQQKLNLCRGTLTGREVADQKSVMRFLLTMSLSALPRSSLEEDKPRLLLVEVRLLFRFWSWIGAVWFSENLVSIFLNFCAGYLFKVLFCFEFYVIFINTKKVIPLKLNLMV